MILRCIRTLHSLQTDLSDPSLETEKWEKGIIWYFVGKKIQRNNNIQDHIWAICQIWMSCCSYWAPSATAPEIEKIKHHMPRSNKLLLDANVALIMKAWSMWMHKRELQQVCSLLRWEEMAVLNVILRKSRQSYMSISIPYPYCRF